MPGMMEIEMIVSQSQEKWIRTSIEMVAQLLRMCIRVFKIRCAFFRNCLNWNLDCELHLRFFVAGV